MKTGTGNFFSLGYHLLEMNAAFDICLLARVLASWSLSSTCLVNDATTTLSSRRRPYDQLWYSLHYFRGMPAEEVPVKEAKGFSLNLLFPGAFFSCSL